MLKRSVCYKTQLDHVLKTQGLSAMRGHLPRALPATGQGVCHLPLWRLQPSTRAEGSRLQGGALHPGSVVEQVFSSWMFAEQSSWSSSSHLLVSREALNPSTATSAPHDWQNSFCTMSTRLH